MKGVDGSDGEVSVGDSCCTGWMKLCVCVRVRVCARVRAREFGRASADNISVRRAVSAPNLICDSSRRPEWIFTSH